MFMYLYQARIFQSMAKFEGKPYTLSHATLKTLSNIMQTQRILRYYITKYKIGLFKIYDTTLCFLFA